MSQLGIGDVDPTHIDRVPPHIDRLPPISARSHQDPQDDLQDAEEKEVDERTDGERSQVHSGPAAIPNRFPCVEALLHSDFARVSRRDQRGSPAALGSPRFSSAISRDPVRFW